VSELPPLGLYLHFPWCVRKCPYCDFNSFALHGELAEGPYVEALIEDLSQQTAALQERSIDSIFLGGGTPSLFSPAALSDLLREVGRRCPVALDAEVTLEANPGTVERGRFADYRAAGLNRVSLGAQSFDDRQLERLGRVHRSADTTRAAEELHAAGIGNFNLDLMYGLPQQSLDEALSDLGCAVALRPAHLSHYQLTLEPGTVFAGQPPAGMPDTDQAGDMQAACQALLLGAGYRQYEVSAYARDGACSRHNLNYWQFGDYLGVGAGAHGKCSYRGADGALMIRRTTRPREPRRYLAEIGQRQAVTEQHVPTSDLPFEFLLNALRLVSGFEPALFEQRTGLPVTILTSRLEQAGRDGLLEYGLPEQGQGQGHWRATPRGMNFLNDLLERFLGDLSDNRKLAVGQF
jgi:oxygen-independent coproporphyrinogen-3 oxidase